MKQFLTLLCFLSFSFSILAQNDDAKRMDALKDAAKMEKKDGWNFKGALGADLGQMLFINPPSSGGQSRIGLGGAIAWQANYQKGRFFWDNGLGLNLSVQRLGSGILATNQINVNEKVPFEKGIDHLALGIQMGYQVKENSKWYYALGADFVSQLTKSYLDPVTYKQYMKNVKTYNTGLLSQFLAPGRLTIGPGITYKPNAKMTFFLSPASAKIILVSNDDIALRVNHGTDLVDPNNQLKGYEKSNVQIGASLVGKYNSNIYKDKITYGSTLNLYSNYKNDPQHIDVLWNNDLTFNVLKNIGIGVGTILTYDHDTPVNISDLDAVGGVSGKGRRVSFYEQLLVKYSRGF